MPNHSSTNFEIQEYYQNEPKYNCVYSRDNLPKIKDGAYVINLDEYSDIRTHWVALYIGGASPKEIRNNNNAIYFDCFRAENIPKEIKAFINHPSYKKTNIFRIRAYDLIMCGYFCIGFIDFMLVGKNLTEFTSLFSQNNFKK